MRHSLICGAIATLAAGIGLAQPPTGNSRSDAATTQEGRRGFAHPYGGFFHPYSEEIGQALNLTASQKEQARMIFQQAQQSAQPIRQELKQNRDRLVGAAKAGRSEGDIEKLAGDQGRLLGKLIAIRTEASAKFYQLLTPDQRIKAGQMDERFRQKARSRGVENGL